MYTAPKTAAKTASVCTGKAPPATPDHRAEAAPETGTPTTQQFFYLPPQREMYGIMGPYHHIIIISSSHHSESCSTSLRSITGAHPGQHPRKEGGTIGGVIYIAK